MSGLRQRKSVFKIVQELDAFPKVPDSYKETTATGGGVSILVFLFIGALVFSEILYYSSTDLHFEYDVDRTFDEKLKINIDLTVAMRCEWVGADVLDLTGQKAETFGTLKEEPVHFQLSPIQRQQFMMTQNLNDYIRDEYHALHKILWKTGYMGRNNQLPAREDNPTSPPDACRLHGTLTVNKVAGNFHITAGKSVPVFPRGHAHLAMMVRESDYNFTHRIEHFSFGEPTPGIICPMDSQEKYTEGHFQMYQYFVQIVPTKVKTMFSELETYQYAYTEHNRPIDHHKGSHGVPGIFVKYDLSPLKVTVSEMHKPYWQFLVRLCGIVGGVFATSGMLHGIVGFFADLVCCRLKIGSYTPGGILSTVDKTNLLNNGTEQKNSARVNNSLLNSEMNISQNPLLQQNS